MPAYNKRLGASGGVVRPTSMGTCKFCAPHTYSALTRMIKVSEAYSEEMFATR